MKHRSQMRSASQLVASLTLISLCMFSAPALVGLVGEAGAADATPISLQLTSSAQTPQKVPVVAQPEPNLALSEPKQAAPIPVVEPPSVKSAVRTSSTKSTPRVRTVSTRSKASSGSELARARSLLAAMVRKYPILAGSTVTIGKTPGGHQAVCYYKSGRILVSPNHRASLDRIIRHEAWHIIDWRDNGHIDWGENVPR